jgi:dihydroflavonol-4-reductase
VTRIVHTSTCGTCGPVAGRAATEADGPPAWELSVPYKRTKLEAERLALAAGAVCVNPTTPVGEGDALPTPTGAMVRGVATGRYRLALRSTGLNLVDVRDVAQGHVLAAERGRVGETYILGATRGNMSLAEIGRLLAELTGRRPPRVRVPYALAWCGAACMETIARVTGGAPRVPLTAVRMARKRMYFSPAKAIRELGLPQTDVRVALRDAVEWFAAHGYARLPRVGV